MLFSLQIHKSGTLYKITPYYYIVDKRQAAKHTAPLPTGEGSGVGLCRGWFFGLYIYYAKALPKASQAASVSALRLCFISTGVPTSSNFMRDSLASSIFFTA